MRHGRDEADCVRCEGVKPYLDILKLVWPLALGMVNTALMQSVDRAFLARHSVAAARMRAREAATHTAADRIECAGDGFHARLRQGFAELAAAEPERIRVIDADGTEDAVGEKVWQSVRRAVDDMV